MVEKNKAITKSNHIYLAYMAGLFDGEGCVTYKQYWSSKRDNRPNKYFCWRIQLEIVMTERRQ